MHTQTPATPEASEQKSPARAGTSPAPAQPVIVLRAIIERPAPAPAGSRGRRGSRG